MDEKIVLLFMPEEGQNAQSSFSTIQGIVGIIFLLLSILFEIGTERCAGLLTVVRSSLSSSLISYINGINLNFLTTFDLAIFDVEGVPVPIIFVGDKLRDELRDER
uniref:Uncharacterized protein n=1 Tax=Romanomermis culicivorax TaxID=13658 RepID=A0A915KIC4_ROMCU